MTVSTVSFATVGNFFTLTNSGSKGLALAASLSMSDFQPSQPASTVCLRTASVMGDSNFSLRRMADRNAALLLDRPMKAFLNAEDDTGVLGSMALTTCSIISKGMTSFE